MKKLATAMLCLAAVAALAFPILQTPYTTNNTTAADNRVYQIAHGGPTDVSGNTFTNVTLVGGSSTATAISTPNGTLLDSLASSMQNLTTWSGKVILTNPSEYGGASGAGGFFDGTNFWIVQDNSTNLALWIGPSLDNLDYIGSIVSPDPASWDKVSTFGGSVLRENGTNYFIYNAGSALNDSAGAIGIAYAPYGATNATKYPVPILTTNPVSGTFDDAGIYHASLIHVGDTYYLYYNAPSVIGNPNYGGEQIGMATASSVFGPYTRVGSGPILPNGYFNGAANNHNGWDGSRTGDPYPFQITSNLWGMFFYGQSGDASFAGGGLAYSTDLTNWTEYPFNPIQIPVRSIRPAPVISNGVVYLLTDTGSGGSVYGLHSIPALGIGGIRGNLEGPIYMNTESNLFLGGRPTLSLDSGVAHVYISSTTPFQPISLALIENNRGGWWMSVTNKEGIVSIQGGFGLTFVAGVDYNYPLTTGTSVLRVNTNGVIALNGVPIGGNGSLLTNIIAAAMCATNTPSNGDALRFTNGTFYWGP